MNGLGLFLDWAMGGFCTSRVRRGNAIGCCRNRARRGLIGRMRLVSLGVVFLVALLVGGGSASGAEAGGRVERLAEKAAAKKRVSDAQIRNLLIEESIAAYDGSCPCPYSRARNGSRCGKRSAHSRENGAAPLCFVQDVSAEMVRAYRDEHSEE